MLTSLCCGRVGYDGMATSAGGDGGSPELVGILDPDFDRDGRFAYSGPVGAAGGDTAYGLDFDPSGRLVVMGTIRNSASGSGYVDGFILRLSLDSGELDATLNGSGVIIVDQAMPSGSWDVWTGGVAAVEDDSFIIGATIDDGLTDDPTVWKVEADGSFDTTWGDLGGFTRGPTPGEVGSYDFWLDSPSGDYLLAGASWTTDGNFYVARFTPSGATSPVFGTDGVVIQNDYGNARARGVVTDSATGDVYATGYGDNGASRDMVLYRFSPDGTLDPAFDTDGHLAHDGAGGTPDSSDEGSQVRIAPDGTIAVVGSTGTADARDLVVWKFATDGTPVAAFGDDGVLVVDGGVGSDDGHGATFGPSGALYLTGTTTTTAGRADMAVWKIDWQTGALDPSFGVDGVLIDDFYGQGLPDAGHRLAFAPNGRLVIVGYGTKAGPDRDIAVWVVR
jgi:uncharacterized delta-60 repeat protein